MIYISSSTHPKIASLGRAFDKIGYPAFMWDSKSTSLFDLLADKSPKIVILLDGDVEGNRIAEYAKNEYPDTKLIWLRSNPNITNTNGFDLVIDIESENTEYEYMEYYIEKDHLYGDPQDRFTCEYLIISNGMDPDNKEQLEWIDTLGDRYSLKIYGDVRIKSIFYLGEPDYTEYKDIMSSSLNMILFNRQFENTAIQNGFYPMMFNSNSKKDYIRPFSSLEDLMHIVKTGKDTYLQLDDFFCPYYTDYAKSIIEKVLV